jgi:ubiquinone biosynthesis protein
MFGDRLVDEADDEDFKGPLRRMLSDKYEHYKRVAEIMAALSRYGFGRLGDTAARVKDLSEDVEVRKELAGERAAVRFRMLLESLGPTFIKLGQMLSTRPDLIDEDFAEELGNLRDDVPPVAFEEVGPVVESELGAPIGELFETFEERPVASASIGQVHKAVVKGTGELVAVKVQRPGITRVIKADIEILRDLANVLRRTFKAIERFDPVGVVDEFGHMIRREVDYTVEARNIQRFRDNHASVPGVHVPRVNFGLSTRRVLTMEWVEGVSLDDVRPEEVDIAKVIEALGTAYIKQIFVDGFFHADPHHDNVFVGPEGDVTFLDFGAVGYLDDDAREQVTDLYMAFMRKDEVKAARALARLCNAGGEVDIKRLEWDLRDFIDYLSLGHKGVEMARGMNQSAVTIALKHRLALPSSYVLLERALLQVEGVARSLDKEFDIVNMAKQNLPMLLKERYMPKREPLQAVETAKDYADFMRELPDRLDTVLTKLEKDDITVKVQMPALDDIRRQLRRLGLMISASLVALAIIAYITWAGTSIDLPITQLRLTVPGIILVWIIVLVVIHRRT